MAYWDGESATLALLDLRGGEVGRLTLPARRYPVTPEDREGWFEAQIPTGALGGQVDPFRALRSAAREQVEFPSEFPPVLGLLADPDGGVWVQRTPAGTGEVWTYVDPRGPRRTLRFPPGRELLAVGTGEMAVKARDELVEVYAKASTR